MQTLNQKMTKIEEMTRGQDMGIKLRTPIRDLELAKQRRNKSLSDSLTRIMNTANLMQNNLTEEDQVGMVI